MTTVEKAFKGIEAFINLYNIQRSQKKLKCLSPKNYRNYAA